MAITNEMIEAYRNAKANGQEWCGCCDSDERRHYIVKGNDILWEHVSDDYVAGHSLMMTELQRLRDANALSAALSAGQAQPGSIKPLEWRDHPIFGGDDLAVANIAEWGEHGHKYQVGRDADAPGYKAFLAPMHGSWFWTSPGHATLEAAKAAAQSDYEARILSALVSPAVVKFERLGNINRDVVEQLQAGYSWTTRIAVGEWSPQSVQLYIGNEAVSDLIERLIIDAASLSKAADRIAALEKENAELRNQLKTAEQLRVFWNDKAIELAARFIPSARIKAEGREG